MKDSTIYRTGQSNLATINISGSLCKIPLSMKNSAKENIVQYLCTHSVVVHLCNGKVHILQWKSKYMMKF